MLISTFHSKSPKVYRLRAGQTTNSYGDPVESWDSPERVLLKGATVQNVSIVEDEGTARHVIRGRKTLYAPGRVDLTTDDRIEVAGEVWKVSGHPVIRYGLATPVYTTSELERVTIG